MQQKYSTGNENNNLEFFQRNRNNTTHYNSSLIFNLTRCLLAFSLFAVVTAESPNNPFNFIYNNTFYSFRTNPPQLNGGYILNAFNSIGGKLVDGALGNVTEFLGAFEGSKIWSGPLSCDLLQLLSNASSFATAAFRDVFVELAKNDSSFSVLNESCRDVITAKMFIIIGAIFSACCFMFALARYGCSDQRSNYKPIR